MPSTNQKDSLYRAWNSKMNSKIMDKFPNTPSTLQILQVISIFYKI